MQEFVLGASNKLCYQYSRMLCTAMSGALYALLFAAEDKLLYDFRGDQPDQEPAVSAEVQRRVLSALFPSYLGNESECKVDEPPTDAALKAARKSGQIVPELMSSRAGSFTKPNARQTAYLIKVGECGATSRTYFGTYRLAIFENGRLVAADSNPRGEYIDAVADVDGDGIQEILLSGCGFGTGTLECNAILLSMAGGSPRTIRRFRFVYEDPCGGSPTLPITATVIRYAPGRPPHFFESDYEAACPPPGKTPQFGSAKRR